MRKLNVAYIGNCSEEFSGVLDSFNGDLGTVISVCDTDIKRGLICVEKYLCNFVEDYHAIISREEMNLVVIESCGRLRQEEICAAAASGKNIYVILDEQSLILVDQVEAAVRESQAKFGTQALFVTVDELDNDFWSGLPVTKEEIGPLLQVTVGMPSRAPGSVSLNRNAYDAVRILYELLGVPETYLGMQGKVNEYSFTGAASFRYPSGALASIVVGGVARAHTVRVYGEKGCAMVGRNMIHYHLAEGPWKKEAIVLQKRRTRKPTISFQEIINGTRSPDIGHTLDEVLVTSRMLRTLLYPTGE